MKILKKEKNRKSTEITFHLIISNDFITNFEFSLKKIEVKITTYVFPNNRRTFITDSVIDIFSNYSNKIIHILFYYEPIGNDIICKFCKLV